MTENKCTNCNHYHASTKPHVCTLLNCDKHCDEFSFVPEKSTESENTKSFEYYQSVIQKLTDMEERIRYMLECIPGMRNTDDWELENQYWHYYINYCTGMVYTVEIFNIIHNEAQPDSITRMRRKICQPDHQAIVKLQKEIEGNWENGIPPLTPNDGRYWEIQREIKNIIKESKYLPTDMELLKSKGIKEVAVKEALLDYC